MGAITGVIGGLFCVCCGMIGEKRALFYTKANPRIRLRILEVLVATMTILLLCSLTPLAFGCRALDLDKKEESQFFIGKLARAYCPDGHYSDMATLVMQPKTVTIKALFTRNFEGGAYLRVGVRLGLEEFGLHKYCHLGVGDTSVSVISHRAEKATHRERNFKSPRRSQIAFRGIATAKAIANSICTPAGALPSFFNASTPKQARHEVLVGTSVPLAARPSLLAKEWQSKLGQSLGIKDPSEVSFKLRAVCRVRPALQTAGLRLQVFFVGRSLMGIGNGGAGLQPGITMYMGFMCLSESYKIYRLLQEGRLYTHPLFELARSDTSRITDGNGARLNFSERDDEESAVRAPQVQFSELRAFGGEGRTLGTGYQAPSSMPPSSKSQGAVELSGGLPQKTSAAPVPLSAEGSAVGGAGSSGGRSAWLEKVEKESASRSKTVRELEEERGLTSGAAGGLR
ncbi:unnamed protein product [Polarella glacialis]|uniref:Uncharacterized protein n=1 Tax=Polarella glacialis TaxID=89957 RepID=A0A813GIE6_POLGL|nr:unnamed protein product [Polarella glacialis]